MVDEIEETGELVVVDEVVLRITNDVDDFDEIVVVDVDVDGVVVCDVLVLLPTDSEEVLVVVVVLDVTGVLVGEVGLTNTVVKVEADEVEEGVDEVGLLMMLAVVEDGVVAIVVAVVVDGLDGNVGNVVNVVGMVVNLLLFCSVEVELIALELVVGVEVCVGVVVAEVVVVGVVIVVVDVIVVEEGTTDVNVVVLGVWVGIDVVLEGVELVIVDVDDGEVDEVLDEGDVNPDDVVDDAVVLDGGKVVDDGVSVDAVEVDRDEADEEVELENDVDPCEVKVVGEEGKVVGEVALVVGDGDGKVVEVEGNEVDDMVL